MIVLIATFKAKPGQEKALEDAIQSLIPDVQNEEGTLVYNLHRARKDAGKFVLYEIYKDKAALDFHSSTPYFQELFSQLGGLAEGQPHIEVFEYIAGIKR